MFNSGISTACCTIYTLHVFCATVCGGQHELIWQIVGCWITQSGLGGGDTGCGSRLVSSNIHQVSCFPQREEHFLFGLLLLGNASRTSWTSCTSGWILSSCQHTLNMLPWRLTEYCSGQHGMTIDDIHHVAMVKNPVDIFYRCSSKGPLLNCLWTLQGAQVGTRYGRLLVE